MTINNDIQLFEKARNETISYHKLYYSRHKLFEEDSWLAKPDAGLMELLDKEVLSKSSGTANSKSSRARTSGQPQSPLKILDLGCGVGRNAVPMAIALAKFDLPAKILGIDVLAESIEILQQNSTRYDVAHIIEGMLADNDEFVIEPQSYDLIAAISVVEHCAGKAKVLKLLKAIAAGLKPGGFARIEMTTDRNVIDLGTKQSVPTYVETPLSERQVKQMLTEAFQDFVILKQETFPYKEILEKDGKKILWQSKQISFSGKNAGKPEGQ